VVWWQCKGCKCHRICLSLSHSLVALQTSPSFPSCVGPPPPDPRSRASKHVREVQADIHRNLSIHQNTGNNFSRAPWASLECAMTQSNHTHTHTHALVEWTHAHTHTGKPHSKVSHTGKMVLNHTRMHTRTHKHTWHTHLCLIPSHHPIYANTTPCSDDPDRLHTHTHTPSQLWPLEALRLEAGWGAVRGSSSVCLPVTMPWPQPLTTHTHTHYPRQLSLSPQSFSVLSKCQAYWSHSALPNESLTKPSALLHWLR
jgi:hypothetical protein